MLHSVVIFLCIFTGIKAEGYYNVIGPRTIRPNSEYHCSISIQGASEPTQITASLQGTSYNGSGLFTQDQLTVLPFSSKISTLKVGDLDDGVYKLTVRGVGGVEFNTDFPLIFVKKSYSIFIQTDRQVYQPGTKILFRVIALNSALKPAAEVREEPLHVHISDGGRNRVKEWTNVRAPRGVFTGELKLSDSPVLGDWNISVTIHGQTYHKTIQVAEYVYPKFIVDIETPRHVTFKQNVIPVNINTRYIYGKKLQGEATITVYPTIYSGVIQPIFQNPIRKVVEIDGTADVDFDIERDLGLNDEYERTVIVDVAIEERLTGRRQNNSVEVHIHKYDYKMTLIKTADYFKPGLPYIAYVKITDHDGNVVNKIDGKEITVRHGYSRIDEVYEERRHNLDKNGVVKVEYITPVNVTNTTALRIEAEFDDLKERLTPIPAAVSYNNVYLKLYLESVSDIVEILVNSTEPMRYINYVIMGRGDVVIANTFQVDNSRIYKFSFRVLHAMAPLCHLFVYYTRNDGELIGDALDIEVGGTLQNNIDIQVNTLESEPELDIEFLVTSKPNSYIGLMAIDQNVKNLKNGYDITSDDVIDELNRYDAAMGVPYPRFARNALSTFSWSPGASNPHSAVYESGADLLTNAHINRHNPTLEDIYLRPVFYGPSTIKPDRGLVLPVHSVTRPPLAGPYAFSRIPRPVWNKPKIYLTGDVSPAWLFQNFSTGYDGKTTLRRRLPTKLTTWVITGFSLDPLFGLGLSQGEKKVNVVKQMVVSLDLPYSIQKGEILAVPIVVKNNFNEDITVDVTLHNAEQKFEFAEVSNEVNKNETGKIEFYRRKKLAVKKNQGASVSFMITAVKVGKIEIKVTANSPKTQDVVSEQLLVTPGGETEYYTKSLLIDLRSKQNLKTSLNFTIPKNAVQDSEKIELAIAGSFLAPAMIHLDDLTRLPTGCGEQNLVKFLPDLIILRYLKITGQSTPTVENEAISNLETGYQKQLGFKRPDGSFSPFGSRDNIGSVWLTAYTMLALSWAKPFIYVDNDVIDEGLNWLESTQNTNGSFYEKANVIHSELQSKNGKSLALTAFVTMAFLESNQRSNLRIKNVVNKALDYIARNINEDETAYSLSLCSYALYLAEHPSKQSAFNLLDLKARTEGNLKFWTNAPQNDTSKNPWIKLPRSIDIETTSYALLTFIEAGLLNDAIPVLDWLEKQQNANGGFASSHDTVVGLYALNKLVTKLGSLTNIQVEFEDDKNGVGKFSVNRNNIVILQSMQINKDVRMVNVTAQGTGIAIFRINYQYNKNVTGPWPMFTLDPQVDKNTDRNHLQISICTAFVSRNLTMNSESNMAVMEVTLPSGFTADVDSLPSLEVSQNVQKVETSHGLTKVVLYFNNITRTEYCPTISAFRTHKVAKQKPVPVVVYDYYDSSRRARVFYQSRAATLCDICEGEDCGNICVSESEPLKQRDGDGSAMTFTASLLVFILTFLTLFF